MHALANSIASMLYSAKTGSEAHQNKNDHVNYSTTKYQLTQCVSKSLTEKASI